MTCDIAVDGGQTGIRLAVVEGARVCEVVEADGFSYRPSADGVADDVQVLTQAIKALGVRVRRVVLGLTNAPHSVADRTRLADSLRSAVDAQDVLITGDMVTAHCGALGGADGVVVAAGTGTVCLAVSGSTWARSDGFGYLLGDEGSGFAVGRAALRGALRASEGRGPATSLVDAMHRHFADIPDFPHGVYRRAHPVGEIAAFSMLVASAATEGDLVARGIWSDAVDELVGSVLSAIERCAGFETRERIAVSYSGGMFAVTDHVREPFVERLASACPRADVRPPVGDALDGAVRMITEDADRYGELVTRVGGRP